MTFPLSRSTPVLIALFACLAVAACSGDDETGPDGGQPVVDAGPTLTDGGDQTPDGGDETPDAGPGPFTLEMVIDPTFVTVPRATTFEAPIELLFDRARAPLVELSITAAADGLAATIDHPSYDGRHPPVLRLAATEQAGLGEQKVTVTALANGLTASVELTVTVTENPDLRGVVVDQNGQPLGGLTVMTQGRTALTGVNGRFVLPNLTPPYDLDIVDGSELRGYRFMGLTRRDPRIQLGTIREAPRMWTVSGSISGKDLPNTTGSVMWVGLDAPRARPRGREVGLDGSYFRGTALRFHGTGTTSGHLWGLLGTVTNGAAQTLAFDAFGELPATAVDKQQRADLKLALHRVSSGAITSTVTAPSGFRVLGTKAWLAVARASGLWLTRRGGVPDDANEAFDDHDPARENLDLLQGSSFYYVAPIAHGTRVSVTAVADSGDRRLTVVRSYVRPDETLSPLDLPSAPTILSPAAHAGVEANADFSWSDDRSDRIYAAAWGTGAAGTPVIVVVTRDTHAVAPDFSAQGLQLPVGTTLPFRVLAVAPYASVDEAAGSRGLGYDYLLPTKAGRGGPVEESSTALDVVPFQFNLP